MSARPFVVVLLAAALLPGCATSPQGPTARVMPAPGKPFQVCHEQPVHGAFRPPLWNRYEAGRGDHS